MTRIISGSAKGRRIATPRGSATRPTSDRVREALFSILEHEFPGEQLRGLGVLDLYSGSGALALEAASRGAAPVTAVEANKATAGLIQSNAKATGLRVQVRAQRAEAFVAKPGNPFRIALLDPPYDLPNEALGRVLTALVVNGWVQSGGLVVVERATRAGGVDWPPQVAQVWSRRYGETTLHFGHIDVEEP